MALQLADPQHLKHDLQQVNMGISKKHRRKILVNGRNFFWYVREEEEPPWVGHRVLHIISEDKNFIIAYSLNQSDSKRHLIVMGKEFPDLSEASYGYRRVRCPQWEKDSAITPESVRRLIEWCLYTHREWVRVNWLGDLM